MLLLFTPVLASLIFVPHWYFLSYTVLNWVTMLQTILEMIVYPLFLVFMGGRLVFKNRKAPGAVTMVSCISMFISVLMHYVCWGLKTGALLSPSPRTIISSVAVLIISLVIVISGGRFLRRGDQEIRKSVR